MRRRCAVTGILLFFSLFPLIVPQVFSDQAEPPKTTTPPKSARPPIAQELVREGDFALRLADALGVASVEDEVEAETKLGDVGIVPRNGWIAAYPDTPDIVAELRDSVATAADARKLKFPRDEALKRFDRVNADFTLGIRPSTAGGERTSQGQSSPNPSDMDAYYNEEGPPVITYYTPPEDYYYLYSWVPAPFWWFDFWFPGYFILNDFHRVCHKHHHHHYRWPHFISNHFNDNTKRRVFRIDPVERFRGHTYGGIGAPRSRELWKTGVPHSDRTIFNPPRRGAPRRDLGTGSPPIQRGTISTPPRSSVPLTPQGGMRNIPGGGMGPSRGGGGFRDMQGR